MTSAEIPLARQENLFMFKPFLVAVLICGMAEGGGKFSAPASCANTQKHERTEPHMGVPFRIVLYSDTEAAANEAFEAAFGVIAHLDQIMSDYNPDSELMQLCRKSGPGMPVKVSPELLDVLTRANRISQQTDGAFDVTVGPVVRLWRRARRQQELPDAERLEEALSKVGYQKITIDRANRSVELAATDMRLDLGGIAKGYAIDRAMDVLKSHGITSALIDGSGDVLVSAAPPGKCGWKIGIAALNSPEGAPAEYLSLAHTAIATSGDAYQFVELDGKRYSHLIDPRTGLGLTERSSVSVIAPDCTTADAWASAVSVLGSKRGLDLIEKEHELSALIKTLQDDREQIHRSTRFPRTTE